MFLFVRCFNRSGFHFLKSSLQQNSSIYMLGELNGFLKNFNYKNENIIEYIEKLKSQERLKYHCLKINNFDFNYLKSNLYQFNMIQKDFYELINKKENKLIHLKRKNIIQRLISTQLARKHNSWTMKKYDLKVDISKKEINSFILKQHEEEIFFLKNKKSKEMLTIYYEDISDNIQKTSDLICDFLDIKKHAVKNDLLICKQRVKPYRELIENFDEFINECNKNELIKKSWIQEIIDS